MLKYYNSMVVFEEMPDEITLAINITNCPCKCSGCHSKFLWADVGTELTFDELNKLIEKNCGITCVCFMGGDSEPSYVNDMATYIKSRYDAIKTAWYSGKEQVSDDVELKRFDYIKVGPYIDELGGLDKETTNQRMYEVKHDKVSGVELIDITYRFWNRRKIK